MIQAGNREIPYDAGRLKSSLLRPCTDKGGVATVELFVPSVASLLPEKIKLGEFVDIVARSLAAKNVEDPFYDKLAVFMLARWAAKQTLPTFSECILAMRENTDLGRRAALISEHVAKGVKDNAVRLNAAVQHRRDYDLTFFAFQTLKRSYLLKGRRNGAPIVYETPQYMWLRVACGIHTSEAGVLDVASAIDTYNGTSTLLFTHATPTLFNSGTVRPQMSSCYLLQMQDDSIDGIFKTLGMTAAISKYAGGIGLSINNIRSKGSFIKGTGGRSNGILPMLQCFNATARYVDQGGGRRKGSMAVYLSPYHADIFDFLDLRLITGKPEARCRDLFTALWVSDLFMERLTEGKMFSLFDPKECPGLAECHGQKFKELYEQYEQEGKAVRQVDPNDIWVAMLRSQTETGTPYVLWKDAANRLSNQQHLGTLKCSNLCTEILEYVDKNEVAVCNLASISLHRFVGEDRRFDYEKFQTVVKQIVFNLNHIIDRNYYPLDKARYSNLKHRPIGLGVQGLADAFLKMKINYDSLEAVETNKTIFEVMYFAAMEASWELAVKDGKYSTFSGSPTSRGLFQFDLHGRTGEVYENGYFGKEKWETLKQKVQRDGCRNSLLVAPMPTASTSQILGSFCESFSPLPSVLYQKRTLAGDFVLCNAQFIEDMRAAGLWTSKMRSNVERARGRVENVPSIPESIRRLYRSCWGMKMKIVLDHAIARAPFICQSQSMNIWMANENLSEAKVSSMLYYGWKNNLKTGLYYLRSQSANKTIQFGLEEDEEDEADEEDEGDEGGEEDEEECVMCGA